MIVNMLRAISKMLLVKDADPMGELKVRVMCAREMLEEIIKGMELNPIELLDEKVVPIRPKHEPQKPAPEIPAKIPKEEDTRPIIAVDKDRKLLPIKGLGMDAKVELDGKVMTHRDAIGRTFDKIKRID